MPFDQRVRKTLCVDPVRVPVRDHRMAGSSTSVCFAVTRRHAEGHLPDCGVHADAAGTTPALYSANLTR